ncbi:MAG: PfkB family carbohydrate kinase [Hyphomicrobiales bacterium]
MTRAPDIVVVGSLHLDILVEAEALPRLDETARGSAWRMVCGGKGGNQACQAARHGAQTAMVSQVGDDDFGRRLLANLEHHGVDRSAVAVDAGCGSGMSVAIQDRHGDYGAVIVSGANLTLTTGAVTQALSCAGRFKLLLLQNEIPEAVNVAAAQAARSNGARVIVNAAPARALPPALTALTDILVVNRVEAEMMAGNRVTSVQEAQQALPVLLQLASTVVVTLGGDGVVVAARGQDPVVIAAVAVAVKSTHGAGDCFVGALSASLAKGDGLVEAARLANAAAARHVAGAA